jgi:hypothetical protein
VADRIVASPAVRSDWLNGSSTTVQCHWLATPKSDRQLFYLDFDVSRDDHWASNPCASNLRVRPFSVQPSHLDYGPRGGDVKVATKTGEFIALPLTMAPPPRPPITSESAVADLHVEPRRGAITMSITLPSSVAAEFALWTRDVLG